MPAGRQGGTMVLTAARLLTGQSRYTSLDVVITAIGSLSWRPTIQPGPSSDECCGSAGAQRSGYQYCSNVRARCPPCLSSRISDYPTPQSLVRLQAQVGSTVTNQKCEAVRLTDAAVMWRLFWIASTVETMSPNWLPTRLSRAGLRTIGSCGKTIVGCRTPDWLRPSTSSRSSAARRVEGMLAGR